MANPTTNYGFVLPTPTDLVTDLPADFDVALQGVDTTLKALNPSTTLGDIEYRSATANTNTRLGIGTSGQVLTVAAGVPSWAAPVAGGMTVIASGSLTGSQVNLTSIPATYKNLRLVVRNYIPASDGDVLALRLQNDSNSRYQTRSTQTSPGNNISFNATQFTVNISQDDTVSQSSIVIDFEDYANTLTWKMARILGINNNQTTDTAFNIIFGAGVYNQTGAISEINLFNAAAGSFNGGTYILYGVS